MAFSREYDRAKGLEMRSVAVISCGEKGVLDQNRTDAVAHQVDLEVVNNTELQLHHTACTGARDHQTVSVVDLVSEFMDDPGS